MRTEELGREVRRMRMARGLTQAALAGAAGISRTTLNQFENGVVPDLGIRKVQAILSRLGMSLGVTSASRERTDFVRVAAATASVSFKSELTEDELIRALLTGKIPAGRRSHLRVLLEESTPAVVRGLIQQIGPWAKPGKVERHLAKIADTLGIAENQRKWLPLP
jgi:transcriptional regulator with XRE-family HTH domain